MKYGGDMKPIIGITPLYDEKLCSIWMIPGYSEAVADAGGLPVILSFGADAGTVRETADMCDGILLTGRQDIAPALYGEEPTKECGAPYPPKDELESALVRIAAEENIPVLGICRGLQPMNVAFGGTLYRDLPAERGSVGHAMTPPYDREVHGVTLSDTPLAEVLGTRSMRVNSYHHQAVKELSPRLVAAAVSDDGITEAALLPGARFFAGVQWHPELRRDVYSHRLFEAFVRAAADCMRGRERDGGAL